MTEHVFDAEERVGLQAFGFIIESDGATGTLLPREATVRTTGSMAVVLDNPNGDFVFMGCYTLISTVAGVEHRGDIRTDGEEAAERNAGLPQLGFVECCDCGDNAYRWAGTATVRIQKVDKLCFDVTVTFPGGDQLNVGCDMLCGQIGGIEWADATQRDEMGIDPSPLLANCA